MASHPEYELRKIVPGEFDPRLLPLWLSALDSPDRDLHRQVGDSLVRAKKLGMKGLDQSVADRLRQAFKEADNAVVRRSIAKALLALDDRTAASLFWEMRQSDYQLALIVEPALGTWKYQPALDEALSRLQDPLTAAPLLRLSMEMLANAKEEKARGPLLELALSSKARSDLRLPAASALGRIFSQGLESSARELCDRDRSMDPLSGLLAARMLSQHADPETGQLLKRLARDQNTAVQALALKRLGQIDQKEVAKFAMNANSSRDFAVTHPDANVRLALIESLYSIADAKAIPVLQTFLDDPHPENRQAAGDALYDLARRNDEFRKSVEGQLLSALTGSSWRTLERAAIVAGGLDSEACSEYLVRLLSHERTEVAVASAWALKELAVPETVPMVLKRLEENLDARYDGNTKAGVAEYEKAQRQCQHLNEQLGLMKSTMAEPTLRRWIAQMDPKRQIGAPLARATGMWALGLIHEDKPNPELTALLIARLNAVNAMFNSEPPVIGEAAAYAVGFMRDPSGLSDLERFAGRVGVRRNINDAAAWAVERITGKALPLDGPYARQLPHWFLEPIAK